MSLLNFTILSLFPEMFPAQLGFSLAKKALDKSIWNLNLINIRDYSIGNLEYVIDDKPFGGGSGMILRADVVSPAIEDAIIKAKTKNIIYMSPRGRLLNQSIVEEIVSKKDWIILCARYEGVDERIIEEYQIEEISIGDYIISGGEIAATVMMDACIRLLPGVIKKIDVHNEESFNSLEGLLEYPLYTRPQEFKGRKVPQILLSGDHKKIKDWKHDQAKKITKKRRTDLWVKYIKNILIKKDNL